MFFGLVSLQLGQQQQALEALKSAEELGPTVVEPHYQLGLLYMKFAAMERRAGKNLSRWLEAGSAQTPQRYYQL